MSRTSLLNTEFKSLGQYVWASYLFFFFIKTNKAQTSSPGDRDAC